MNIGIFSDTYKPYINGVATSVDTLKKVLEEHGHTVFVITTNDAIAKVELKDRILRIGGIELKKLYGNRLTSFYSFKAYRFIKQMNLDIVHVQTEFGIGIFGRICSESLKVPMVYTYHTTYEDYTHYISKNIEPIDKIIKVLARSMSRFNGDHCDALISPSDKTKQLLLSYDVERKIDVIPTGIDLNRFDDSEIDFNKVASIKKQFNIQDQPTIITVGRLGEEKSVDMIIDGYAQALKEMPDLQCVIVGDGPALQQLKQQAQDMGLGIIFTGSVSNDEIPLYYRLGDIFVSASTTETQGLTFMEAQASGLPVLCRYDDNLKEVVLPGINGDFFEDATDFTSHLMSLYKEDFSQIKIKAKESVQPYSTQVFYDRIIKVYRRVLDAHPIDYKVASMSQTTRAIDSFDVLFKVGESKVKLCLPEEIVNDFGIKVGRVYQRHQIDCLKEYADIIPLYEKAMKWLVTRIHTRKEVEERLKHVPNVSNLIIKRVIKKLEESHLIDDEEYAKRYLKDAAYYQTGIEKACRDLVKRGISQTIIDDSKMYYEHEILLEKVMVLIKKELVKNKNRSHSRLMDFITHNLVEKGYEEEVIDEAFEMMDLNVDYLSENLILMEQYERYYQRFQAKYEDEELKQKIYEKLILKGFDEDLVFELINRVNEVK